MRVIAFFSNRVGVGTSTLVYNLAWMLVELGRRTLAADFDPQCALTQMFIPDNQIEQVWPNGWQPEDPDVRTIIHPLALLPGSLELSDFVENSPNPFTAPDQALRIAGERTQAEIALVDLGPNLDFLNRTLLTVSDYLIVPVQADFLSSRALRIMGRRLAVWRQSVCANLEPLGCIGLRTSAGGVAHWYRDAIGQTPRVLSHVGHYPALASMARIARQPMFQLTPGDSQAADVQECYKEYRSLAEKILAAVDRT